MIFSGFICPFYILESLETSRISLSSSKPLSLKPEFFLAPVPQPKKKMKSHLKVPGLVVVEAEAPSPVSSRPETQGLVVVEAEAPTPVALQSEVLRSTCTSFLRPVVQGKHDKFYRLEI